MAVYKRTYKVYNGPLSPAWSRFAVLTRYSLGTLFDSKLFTAYSLFCLLPFLAGTAQIYFAHSRTAAMLLDMHLNIQPDSNWFFVMLLIQSSLGFILMAWATPGIVTRDFANQALQLYFSRPLSRKEYILGKISVLVILLSCITWIPLLLLFGLQAQMEGNGWGWKNLYLVGAILVSSWLWIAVMSLLGLALSVWVRWRIAATGLILAVFFVLPGFGEAFNMVLSTHWGTLLNLSRSLQLVSWQLFRVEHPFDPRVRAGVPIWSAWAAILTACFIALLLLNKGLKAREVVRS
jgi:ABC-2 type transport system permease protein